MLKKVTGPFPTVENRDLNPDLLMFLSELPEKVHHGFQFQDGRIPRSMTYIFITELRYWGFPILYSLMGQCHRILT